MKKIFIKTVGAALLSLALIAGLSSCADENGLHDQNATKVTIKFTNFSAAEDGDYAIPGDFNGDTEWEYSNSDTHITLKGGEGTSSVTFNLTATWVKFTLVKKGEWTRAWCPALEGNSEDEGKLQNFYIGELDPDAGEITLVIDGNYSGTDDVISVQ